MENSKIKQHILNANNSRLKYISLISLGYSILAVSVDFFVHGVWQEEYLFLYKTLDIVLAIISVSAVSFFWLFKIKNSMLQKAVILILPYLFLIWSAVITGIDFNFLGFSTFLIVVLLATFFLYINPATSIVYFGSSCLTLILTMYFRGELDDNYLPLLVLIVPTYIISILISARNYRNIMNDLLIAEKMAELNWSLQYSNQNLEIEIEKRTREILLALEKAKESDCLKSNFLANISHEIRTPFNGILGFLPLMQNDDLTASERDEYIGIINKSAYRLMNTINDIVEISQIQAGQMKLTASRINISSLTDELYDHFKTDAKIKGLEFSINKDLPSNMECIYTDSIKLNSILFVLIGNAIKFSKTGSIVIGLRKNVDYLEFSVKDTGIGISENKLSKIFERFVQVDGSSTRQFEGSGLGLSIAKAYVEILGGNIWVESEEGKGSTFYFTFPYNAESEEEVVVENVVSADIAGNHCKNLKILIAEDDETAERLMTIKVEKYCEKVLIAKNGVEAVQICRNNPDIDLVFMDIKMPELNGYEATKQIRQFNKKVIIFAQTAYALTGERERAIEAGCNDYISKPFDQTAFSALMEKYFSE